MVQFGAALNPRSTRQGGVSRFLDLCLLQLCQHVALRDQALRDIQGQGARRGRRPHPGISLRTIGQQCAGCAEAAWYHLSGGAGQRFGDLECLARNQYWPAQYIVDQRGNVVFSHAGEGQYDEIERTVRRLLNATS